MITAMLFGFAGVCTGFIPIIPVALGAIGGLMAARALFLVSRRDATILGLSLMAMVLSLVAGGWGLYSTLSGDRPVERLQELLSLSRSGRADGENDKSKILWHDATSEAARVGNVDVQITDAVIGDANELKNSKGTSSQREEPPKHLLVSVKLRNRSTQNKLDYVSWSGRSPGGAVPKLQDNIGNVYDRVLFVGRQLTGQLEREAIYPGKAAIDLIVFERPVANYEYLELSLPGAAFGEKDVLHFRIPRNMVTVLEAPTHEPKRRPRTVETRADDPTLGDPNAQRPREPKNSKTPRSETPIDDAFPEEGAAPPAKKSSDEPPISDAFPEEGAAPPVTRKVPGPASPPPIKQPNVEDDPNAQPPRPTGLPKS